MATKKLASTKEITIRMPKRYLRSWLKALRSGEYRQGKGALYSPTKAQFCCLGVLQHVVMRGKVEHDENGFRALPTEEWGRRFGIECRITAYGSLNPYLPTLRDNAANLNDDGTSFKKLADAIEACAEGV